MLQNKSASQRLRWAQVALVLCGTGLGLVMAIATTSGCAQKEVVSNSPPASDADMQKVVINVYGMT